MPTKYLFVIVLMFCVGASVAMPQTAPQPVYENTYQKGDYKAAVALARKTAKSNPSDWHAHYYAGLSLLKLKKEKDAVKYFEKAVSLNPVHPMLRTALAFSYMLRNENRARTEAYEALKLKDDNADANYILAIMDIRSESYDTAYKRAKRAIEIDPRQATAYVAKAQALVSSFAKQSGTILHPEYKRYALLEEACIDIEKFLELQPSHPDAVYYTKYHRSLKYFADYYSRNQDRIRELDTRQNSQPVVNPNRTPLTILAKQKAQYTSQARDAMVSGSVMLLVNFSADATIDHVVVIKPLGYGLDEQAIAAARAMKFKPETENGAAVSTVRPVTFTFNIF